MAHSCDGPLCPLLKPHLKEYFFKTQKKIDYKIACTIWSQCCFISKLINKWMPGVTPNQVHLLMYLINQNF